MATFKRGSTWYYEFVFHGRRFRQSAGQGSTQSDAKSLEAAHRLRLIRSATARKVGTSGAHTFADGIERWLAGEGARFALDKRFLSRIKNARPHLNHVALTDGIEAAEQIRASLAQRGIGPATINRHLVDIRRILNLAYQWGWLAEKLADRIPLQRVRNRRRVILSPEQVDTIVKAARNPEVARAIELAAYTGLRRGELLSLDERNLDLENHTIVLFADQTKDEDDRRIPVPKPLSHLLTPWPIGVTDQTLRDGWIQARSDSGIKEVQFRDLRHSYLTWGAKAGVPASVLQQLAGHSSLAMTQWYIDVSKGGHQDEIARLSAWALPRRGRKVARRPPKSTPRRIRRKARKSK